MFMIQGGCPRCQASHVDGSRKSVGRRSKTQSSRTCCKSFLIAFKCTTISQCTYKSESNNAHMFEDH